MHLHFNISMTLILPIPLSDSYNAPFTYRNKVYSLGKVWHYCIDTFKQTLFTSQMWLLPKTQSPPSLKILLLYLQPTLKCSVILFQIMTPNSWRNKLIQYSFGCNYVEVKASSKMLIHSEIQLRKTVLF